MANITFKKTPISTNGQLPKQGTVLPDFALVDKELNTHSLKDYPKKHKILSIVPSLDTSVCSLMAKTFNDKVKNTKELLVLVISADLPFAQKRFCTENNADNIVTLSMMRDKNFARDYGVLIQDGPLAGLCARAVIVVDENNKVLYTELVSEITEEPNYDQALSYALRQ